MVAFLSGDLRFSKVKSKITNLYSKELYCNCAGVGDNCMNSKVAVCVQIVCVCEFVSHNIIIYLFILYTTVNETAVDRDGKLKCQLKLDYILIKQISDRVKDSKIGGIVALAEVAASGHWRVFVGAVAAGDHSLIIRLEEEGQRLTCAGVSSRGQHNSVDLRESGQPRLLTFSIFNTELLWPK